VAKDDLARAFKKGDVVYGLRDPLFEAIATLRQPRHVEKRRFLILGKLKKKALGIIQLDITDAVWKHGSPKRYSTDKEIKDQLVDGRMGRRFRDHLRNHARYDVASQYERGVLEAGFEDRRKAWGRTSKAGLEFHLSRGATVHFLVTDIKLADVAQKSGTGGPDYITAKELRWLYRNRRTPEVANNVKFYNSQGRIAAEDFWARPEWASYIPRAEQMGASGMAGPSTHSGPAEQPNNYWKTQVAQGQVSHGTTPSESTRSSMVFSRP